MSYSSPGGAVEALIAVPIRAILEAEHGPLFGPAEIAALTAVFDAALRKLELVDRDASAATAVAKLERIPVMFEHSPWGLSPRSRPFFGRGRHTPNPRTIHLGHLLHHQPFGRIVSHDCSRDCHVSEAVCMTTGVLLRIFVLEGQRHHGELLYDWLLRRAREMGIKGGAAFREIAGYGRHGRYEQTFFELAGGLPVEVVFATTPPDSEKFLDLLARETLSLFYIKSPCEFGYVGE
jgi:uncharacterized protein